MAYTKIIQRCKGYNGDNGLIDLVTLRVINVGHIQISPFFLEWPVHVVFTFWTIKQETLTQSSSIVGPASYTVAQHYHGTRVCWESDTQLCMCLEVSTCSAMFDSHPQLPTKVVLHVQPYHAQISRYSLKRSDVTRWKQGYIRPPPPYFILWNALTSLGENKVI